MKPREMKQKIKIKENDFFIIYNEKKFKTFQFTPRIFK